MTKHCTCDRILPDDICICCRNPGASSSGNTVPPGIHPICTTMGDGITYYGCTCETRLQALRKVFP